MSFPKASHLKLKFNSVQSFHPLGRSLNAEERGEDDLLKAECSKVSHSPNTVYL